MQGQVQDLSNAGCPFISVSGFPGIHGIGVLGMQGIGCKRPRLAAVAAATTGLTRERHMPNGAILSNGLWSEMLPIGIPAINTVLTGRTVSVDVELPMVHLSIAVDTTKESAIVLVNQLIFVIAALISILLPAFIAMSLSAF